LPTTLTLLDDDREALADTGFTTDVRGSVWSTESAFGLGALAFTVVSVAIGAVDRSRRRLAPSRGWRAARFAAPGLTLGLAFAFGLAAVRFVAPRPSVWLPAV